MSMHDYRPLDKMDFSQLTPVTFPVEGTAKYTNYQSMENRIRQFPTHQVIGKDASNNHNIYRIDMGTIGKPTIMLMSGIHGTEYQGVLYNLSLMEDLRDDNFPVPGFRDELLNNFHIIFMPCMNPWGINRTTPYAITRGRRNFVNTDINREFHRFQAQEARVAQPHMDDPNIFAFADMHLLRTHSRDGVVFVGHGQEATRDIRDYIVASMNDSLSKETVKWEAFERMTWGITRRYMRDKMNNHTQFTLSYTIELARPVDETNYPIQRPFDSDEELHEYGYKVGYLFFRTSMDYYYAYHGTGEYGGNDYDGELNKINLPHKTVTFERDEEHRMSSAFEDIHSGVDEGRKIRTTVKYNQDGTTNQIERTPE